MDFSKKTFRNLVNQSNKMIESWYSQKIRGEKIYENKTPSEIKKVFRLGEKNKQCKPEDVLSHLDKNLLKYSNFNPSPNYYGYITGSGNQIGIIGEFLKSALNQNNLKWHSAPANTEIEKICIDWISKFIGYYNKKSAGVFVSGGSVANLMNIAIIRKIKGHDSINKDGIYGSKTMRVYVSAESHSSIDKAMDILGLGINNLVKIEVDDEFKLQPKLLRKKIREDLNKNLLPIGVIGTAGTTNTGSIDPLDAISKICEEFNLWFMVDAAYGGPAASLSSYKKIFKGLDKADSILINPHKWLFVPFEVACVIVKNKDHLKKTFSLIPEYLQGGTEIEERDDLMNYSIQLSKDFKALKVWMTIKTFGYSKIQRSINNDIDMAKYAYQIAKKDPLFQPLHYPELSILCFKYLSNSPKVSDSLLNKKITEMVEEDGRVFLSGTKINNEYVLRINCVNHRREKQDIDFLFKVLRDIAKLAEETAETY